MDAKWIFFDDRGLLRSGWRVSIFVSAFLIAALFMGFIGAAILYSLSIPFDDAGSATYLVLNGLLLLIPAVVLGWLCGKLLEGLPFRALGASFTSGWLRHLLIGLAVGGATVSFAVLIALVFGGLRFELNVFDSSTLIRSLGMSFVIFAVAAAFEEALFRGYIFQTLTRSDLAYLAIALTSLFFGAIHAGNPNASIIGVIDTMLAGIWFGIGYLKTRDLWFVWGMHLMWNWMLGSVFGVEVSGMTEVVSAPLLREIDSGPEWLTGGNYGIEGGIASTIALIVSTVVIWFMPGLKPAEEMVGLTSERQ